MNSSPLFVLEKRAKYLDQDYLWKRVIRNLFEPFMLFFAPDLYEKLDWSKKTELLEQELHSAIPKKEGGRVADKLIKAYLKDGDEQWVYIHVEVQGDGHKEDFSERMFQSFYRIYDIHGKKIYAIAIFTDASPSFKPTTFSYRHHGTDLTYTYNTYKLLEQDETALWESKNPFSLPVLAEIYMNRTRNNPRDRYQFKRRFLELLLQDKGEHWDLSDEDMGELFFFIDGLLKIPKDINRKLTIEMMPLIEKEASRMAEVMKSEPSPTWRELMDQKIAEGEQKGKQEERLEVARKMLQEGFSVESIARVTELSEKELEALKKR